MGSVVQVQVGTLTESIRCGEGLWQVVHNTGSSPTYQARCRGRFFWQFDRWRGCIVPLPKCHGVLQDQTALHVLRKKRSTTLSNGQPIDRHGPQRQSEQTQKRRKEKKAEKAACTWKKKHKSTGIHHKYDTVRKNEKIKSRRHSERR